MPTIGSLSGCLKVPERGVLFFFNEYPNCFRVLRLEANGCVASICDHSPEWVEHPLLDQLAWEVSLFEQFHLGSRAFWGAELLARRAGKSHGWKGPLDDPPT